jgi:PAS domain S-box-containing protein
MSPFLQKKTRILLVDDDQDDYFITSEYIREIEEGQFEIAWANTYQQALSYMKEHAFDIYFVDYRLGAKTGVELLKEAIASKCEEPIILLTGKGNRAIDREAMKLGAFDYLVKSELNTEKLERTIRYALERSSYVNAIKRNERKYRNIFEQSMDAVFIADMDLKFRDVNPAAKNLLGYSTETLYNLELPEIIDDELTSARLRQLLQAGRGINDREVDVKTGSGERKSCILSASVETDEEGQSYIQGILHDITNLRKNEWLTLQAEKLAATGRLVRTLAHEVRNPLNNITLSAEQMMQEVNDEGSLLYINVIRRNSIRISNIIAELLNSARPTDIELKVICLQNLMEEVMAICADSIRLKQVKVESHILQEPLYVLADMEKLEIAIINIIVNAVEAMEEQLEEGRHLYIRIDRREGQAIIEVMDSGCGISDENLGRLFEPYYTSKRNGMGLGLASTLNIIQSHKGYIDVNSALGKGTTFTINLPLHQE